MQNPLQSTIQSIRGGVSLGDTPPHGHGFGTAPVFLAAISTILGAVMFLRFGYAVGNVGLFGTLMIILIGHAITIPTALAVAEIATNLKVEGGGEYFIISRSFGTTIGAAIGISLYFSQAVSVAFYTIAFAEAFRPIFPWIESLTGFTPDPRMFSLPAVLCLVALMLTKGADVGVKALWGVVSVLAVSLVMFFLGGPVDGYVPSGVVTAPASGTPVSFAIVFAICFPAFTGMTAGVGLSGDLKDPRRSIPLGTISAALVGMLVYVLVALKLYYSASPADLSSDQLIMARIALWGPIIPIGLAAATLSSAVGSILVAPRTLQALAADRAFPLGNGFLSKGRGHAHEPVNATLITAVIAVIFVAIGDVNFVAQIISMFFMVTYGALCGVSFLEHFAASPSYRPSFRSRWYLSLLGSILCFVMMFQMSSLYASFALLIMLVMYVGMLRTNKEARGLAALFQGASFQLTRWLQIFLQKSQPSAATADWRPSFIAISRHTLDRLAPFELLRWISHKHGFGTFLHYVEGYLSRQKVEEARGLLRRLISQTEASGAGIFVDTMISPSFTTALAQAIQMPGVSGLDNNSVLFEFYGNQGGELEEVVAGCTLAGGLGYNVAVLSSSQHNFGYKRKLHVWLTRDDELNENLMILLAYIILGHPDWKHAAITIFATFPSHELTTHVEKLNHRIATGRLPIPARNVQALPSDDASSFHTLMSTYSRDADLILLGFQQDVLKNKGTQLFTELDLGKDILYINANQSITIS